MDKVLSKNVVIVLELHPTRVDNSYGCKFILEKLEMHGYQIFKINMGPKHKRIESMDSKSYENDREFVLAIPRNIFIDNLINILNESHKMELRKVESKT